MVSFEKSAKFETFNFKLFCLRFCPGTCMKGSPLKCTALKIDVIGPENLLFARVSMHHSAWKNLQAGAVKGLRTITKIIKFLL